MTVIAVAQSSSRPADVAANVRKHVRFAEAAAKRGVQLIVFPELSLTGYELAIAREHKMTPDNPALQPLRAFAQRASMTIVVGLPLAGKNGLLYIGAVAFGPDGSATPYTKVHVHESEMPPFSAGAGGSMLNVAHERVALSICRDASFPKHAAAAAEGGATVYAAGAMIIEPDYPRKSSLLQDYARRHRMIVLLANYAGASGGDVSAGKSAIWSETGDLICAGNGNEEALVIASRTDGGWCGEVVPM